MNTNNNNANLNTTNKTNILPKTISVMPVIPLMNFPQTANVSKPVTEAEKLEDELNAYATAFVKVLFKK
jgi:hypothetical protein